MVAGRKGITERKQPEPEQLAVGETVILLHPPLPVVVFSIVMQRGRQQNDSSPAARSSRSLSS